MLPEVHKIQTKEMALYDDFVAHHRYTSFFQARPWGDFQKQIPGRTKVWYCGIFKEKKLVGTMLIVRHVLPMGLSWLYTPRGPLIDWADEAVVQAIKKYMTHLAHTEKAIFWRVDPLVPYEDPQAIDVQKALKQLHAQPAHASFQPEYTRMVDLTDTEEDILKQMKPKGRYNIKLAAKKGVTVEESNDAALFTKMMQETAQRDGFSVHAEKTYTALLKTLKNKPEAKLYVAYSPTHTPLAAAIVLFYGKTATYLYGASVSKNREFMAPYLLHWEIMRHAKEKGCTTYDFFGIAPDGDKKHPWAGVAEFKGKFGGKEVRYREAGEVVFHGFLFRTLCILKICRNIFDILIKRCYK